MREERVLILAPLGRDGALAYAALNRAGFTSQTCRSMTELCSELRAGAGAALLTEEALVSARAAEALAQELDRQPPWSDIPVIVFGAHELRFGGHNLTLLSRPVPMRTLLSAVAAALRARRRQYEVRDLLSALEQSVRDRDQFLAMLGHELRNPLAAIVTAVELLDRSATDASARERGVLRRQARHLARLVDDLLDVARVTRGRIALRLEAVALQPLVARVLAGFENAAEAQGVALGAELADDALELAADPIRLEQILANLVANAIKYTNAGGKVSVHVRAERAEIVILVRDTGIGIDGSILPRIFDLFTQAPGALDRSQGGMGIGLTVVQRLVSMHGGTVVARSEGPGKGSEFEVRLPRGTLARDAETPHAPAPSRPLRVLLVEDNADAREVLQAALEHLGHQVEPVGDGDAAVERAVSLQPDVMIVDLGLPGRDGFEVAREVRRSLGGAVRLVALTGYGQPSDRARASAAGYDAFLVKPAELDVLDRALRSQG